ncbi:hypothetical protein CLAIMM_00903 isoform 2 [Cladophialophora immunda]|nr:hypothetical protein CLAIMM_00903 isoform 2 [Cladophialophora immunda]
MGRPNELPVHLGQGPWNDNLGTGLRTCCCGGNVGVELSQPLEQWQSRQTKSIAVLCCRYKYCFRGNLDLTWQNSPARGPNVRLRSFVAGRHSSANAPSQWRHEVRLQVVWTV